MRGIDFHVHPGTKEDFEAGGKYAEAAMRYFRRQLQPISVEELAERYQSLDLMGVLLAWDCETHTGLAPLSNDYIADITKRYPERFVGFACVDPWKGRRALQELDRAVKSLGLHGVKFHPTMQAFYPDDERFYGLWEKCRDLQVPVVVHTGTSAFGGASPGGSGILLDYSRPIYIDGLAADFPEMPIIAAHIGWPWHEELLAIALQKTNVYIDLSGWIPKYLPSQVLTYANTLLSDRMLFGSDHPYIDPARWLEEFDKLPLKLDVKQKILLDNARKLLKL